MELEFDNEINALLRKEASGRTITISEFAAQHLDADEISAFAENAVPDAAKMQYIAHFADCGDCRKTLSSVIRLNSDAGTQTSAAAVVAAPAGEPVLPWYKKLFIFPNLAYVMGGLVIMFGGFLAFSVLQYSTQNTALEVSQIGQEEPAAVSGPNAGSGETFYNANASSLSNSMTSANTVSNIASANSNMTVAKNPMSPPNAAAPDAEAPADSMSAAGSASSSQPAPAPTAAATPSDRPVVLAERDDSRKKVEEQAASKESESKNRELSVTSRMPAGGPAKLKGPSRRDRSDSISRDMVIDGQESTKPPATASGRRQAGGKTFDFRQGAWYDSTYRGQATTNVRRGTVEYRNINSAVRSIAESVPGIVVVVSGNKAYRIQ